MRTTASPSRTTFTRQSTRCSPPAGISIVCSAARRQLERVAVELEPHVHLLVVWQVVVDVGGEHDFVLLDEEPRRLQRTMRFLRVTTSADASPTRVPWPMPQTRIFQAVRFSRHVELDFGRCRPCRFRATATQKAVSANSLRTRGLNAVGGRLRLAARRLRRRVVAARRSARRRQQQPPSGRQPPFEPAVMRSRRPPPPTLLRR